ncbi:MAG: methylenetetrahydrofolate reductase [NAD(P)H] [Pseudomonadota bacterium]
MTKVPVSFEFFPPRTPAGVTKLKDARSALARLRPEFFSVTFGAGGSTQDLTLETVLESRDETHIDSAPHISCIGFDRERLSAVLHRYQEVGIERLVALRGDLPSGMTGFGELRYARDLVQFIREQTGDAFTIHVAGYPETHPQARSANDDIDNFASKISAGANSGITQYFYNPDAYFRFVEACDARGVNAPIVPGIMPITNYTQLKRFSDMCGAELPRWIETRLRDFGDDIESIRAFGIDVTTRLCESLVNGGAPAFHFYTMNQHQASIAVCENLGLGQ